MRIGRGRIWGRVSSRGCELVEVRRLHCILLWIGIRSGILMGSPLYDGVEIGRQLDERLRCAQFVNSFDLASLSIDPRAFPWGLRIHRSSRPQYFTYPCSLRHPKQTTFPDPDPWIAKFPKDMYLKLPTKINQPTTHPTSSPPPPPHPQALQSHNPSIRASTSASLPTTPSPAPPAYPRPVSPPSSFYHPAASGFLAFLSLCRTFLCPSCFWRQRLA